jgi:putative ABC transport system ATP-binding protein
VTEDVLTMNLVGRRYSRSGAWALRDVSLRVPAGTFVAVMGATGSGKSTLLHCAAGLDRPTTGEVMLAGRSVTRMREAALTRLRRDRVGFVFQSYNLLSELTVRQNVLLPSRLGGRPVSASELGALLGDVGLAGAAGQRVGQLSGGQQQRVAVARALVTRPAVIFADEPTGALDPTTGGRVLQLLRDAVDRLGVTVVMVTHDPAAARVSDRLLLLRDGRLVADDPTPDAATIAVRLAAVSGAVAVSR